METKQTAVDFLIDNIHYINSTKWDDIVEQAKKIEKEQIIDAYNNGAQDAEVYRFIDERIYAELYYKTAYEKD